MAINLKNAEVEKLVEELSRLAGESKTEVIKKALKDRKTKLSMTLTSSDKRLRLLAFLKERAWPSIEAKYLGHAQSKSQKEEILGYGDDGV